MITTVIFDLDDTLYDEIDFCRSGFQSVARFVASLSDSHSPEAVFAVLWDCFTTGHRGSTFNAALRQLAIAHDEATISKLLEVYRTHVPTLTLPAESRSTLEALRERYTLALLTDGFLPTQRLKVQALGIEPYFRAILYTEDLGRQFWKPSPRGFEELMALLDARPEQTVYVADNENKDFIAPNRLGLLTIRLVRPRGLYKESSSVAHAAPRRTIDRIDRLPAILAES